MHTNDKELLIHIKENTNLIELSETECLSLCGLPNIHIIKEDIGEPEIKALLVLFVNVVLFFAITGGISGNRRKATLKLITELTSAPIANVLTSLEWKLSSQLTRLIKLVKNKDITKQATDDLASFFRNKRDPEIRKKALTSYLAYLDFSAVHVYSKSSVHAFKSIRPDIVKILDAL